MKAKTLRRCPFVLLFLLLTLGSGRAQEGAVEPAKQSLPPLTILPFEEDWSFLADLPRQRSVLDRIKYIRFGEGTDGYLSLGGEWKGVYEHVLNDNWSNQPYALNSFGLQRYLFHTDLHLNKRVRVYLELESGLEEGRPDGGRPIDKKRLDLLNAFIDLKPWSKPHTPTVRVGKQELQLGSGRSVSVREGTNVREAFFGVRIDDRVGRWDLTGFAVHPAIDRPGFFDDGPLGGTSFWGVLANHKWKESDQAFAIDTYYYGLDRKSATYNRGTAQELRQTIGFNLMTDTPRITNRPLGLHLDVESIYQAGTFGDIPIRAWTIASETGISFSRLWKNPTLGLRADIASGDKGGRSPLGTFNPLFPAGNYFGVLADTGPGPSNFRDLHPELMVPLSQTFTLTPDWIFWWRQELQDGVYAVPGMLLVPAGNSKARYVGNRPGVEAHWQLDRHTYMHFSYGVFFAGPFLKESGARQNLNYLSYGLGFKF